MAGDPTLHEALAKKGYTTQPAHHQARDILYNGKVVFTGNAQATWKWIKTRRKKRGRP